MTSLRAVMLEVVRLGRGCFSNCKVGFRGLWLVYLRRGVVLCLMGTRRGWPAGLPAEGAGVPSGSRGPSGDDAHSTLPVLCPVGSRWVWGEGQSLQTRFMCEVRPLTVRCPVEAGVSRGERVASRVVEMSRPLGTGLSTLPFRVGCPWARGHLWMRMKAAEACVCRAPWGPGPKAAVSLIPTVVLLRSERLGAGDRA